MARLFAELKTFDDFERVVDPAVFTALPDDWMIGVSDIVNSTGALAAGRYKDVNLAGAAVISALMNGLGHRDFPFVFAGDGASFAVPPADAVTAKQCLAVTARWVQDDLKLELRVALVPVSAARAAGQDVRVARFAASASASYAMFSGGGLAWAESRAKAGDYLVARASPGSRPDLTGLSCRWRPLRSAHGIILSLVVQRRPEADRVAFADTIGELLSLVRGSEGRQGHPVGEAGPDYLWPPQGLQLEALATRKDQPTARRRRTLLWQTFLALILFRTGWRIGRFEPKHYLRQTSANSDFRKFDDGLRMTIDCRTETADRIEQMLAAAERDGTVCFGLHRQTQALMTCIVPSIMDDDHLHFIDGAGGGYAMASAQLKTKVVPRTALDGGGPCGHSSHDG